MASWLNLITSTTSGQRTAQQEASTVRPLHKSENSTLPVLELKKVYMT